MLFGVSQTPEKPILVLVLILLKALEKIPRMAVVWVHTVSYVQVLTTEGVRYCSSPGPRVPREDQEQDGFYAFSSSVVDM